jgi:hypothetical protein
MTESTIIVAGFECPKTTSDLAKKCLRKLRKLGMVIFEHDDGPGILVREELKNIAFNDGIWINESPYRLILINNETSWNHFIVKG